MLDNSSTILLASKSVHRAEILKNAGVAFEVQSADIDERAVEQPLLKAGLGGDGIAEVLAIAKAAGVSEQCPGAYVIGCDQTLSLDGELLHKPENMDAARRRLLALSGKTHQLNSAVCIVRNAETIYSHTEICHVTFRNLNPGFVGRHLALAGQGVLSSVGAYQIEGLGVQLFERIDGDFFSIMGLPILPLLKQLRSLGIIDE